MSGSVFRALQPPSPRTPEPRTAEPRSPVPIASLISTICRDCPIIASCMQPTNVGNPDYYHRVVDCQWACPAHTNVPEYIRLIAQGRFTEAYMVNRESNVFPGILGRTCDRPCEPACRRTRVDGKPVAICRLKRVAADNRGEVAHLLPTAPDGEERQEDRADRRRAGVADRGQRPDAARLLGHDLREAAAARRADAHQHPRLPAARSRSSTRRSATSPTWASTSATTRRWTA